MGPVGASGMASPGNTTGGSITVPLTSCLTGLDYSVLQIKTKIVSWHTANSKPVKQEVNGTVILPPSVFPGYPKGTFTRRISESDFALSLPAHKNKTFLLKKT